MDTPSADDNLDLPASFVGAWTVLRPVSHDDFLTLFGWRAKAFELHLQFSSKKMPAYEEFVADMDRMLRDSVLFLTLEKEELLPIGFAQAYSMNLEQGWCFTVNYTDENWRSINYIAEPYMMMLDNLFHNFALRKVYADLYEFDLKSLGPLEACGFKEEGRLREHMWFDDRYWDLIRYAIFRDEWIGEGRSRLALILNVGEEATQSLTESSRGSVAD